MSSDQTTMVRSSVTRIAPEQTIDAIALDRADLREALEPMYASLPSAGYVLPMVWRCAVAASNNLVDTIPRYSSADHGSLFKALLAVAQRVLAASDSKFEGPHFDEALDHDKAVQSCFDREYQYLAGLNMEISLRANYWRLSYHADDDSFRISLSPPQRRSALVLLDHKAEFLGSSPELREILSGATSEDPGVGLTLAKGLSEVAFLRDAVPEPHPVRTDERPCDAPLRQDR